MPATAAAVVFIAIVLISVTVVWLRPHTIDAARDLSDATTQASPATPSEEASFAGEAGQREHAGQDASAAPLPVLVHVVGEVQRPGVYELAEGSRVLAAIEAAGGATDTAALTAVNLARILVDGEQLVIPNAEAAASAAAPAAPAGATPGTAPAGGLVSLNTADQAALETLPRVGPALAARIVAWRSANGGFQSIDQLLNVSGIGQKTFEQLQEHVTL